MDVSHWTLWFIFIWICGTDGGDNFFIAETGWTVIRSPNYPDNYPNNADLLYEIIAPDPNYVVCVQAPRFDLELSTNCNRDYVSLQNSLTSDPVGTWCGTYMPPTCSEADIAYIRFRSDNNNVTGTGFRIMYRAEYKTEREGVPVPLIIGVSIVPVTILALLACYVMGRRKKRYFRDPLEATVIRRPQTQTSGNENSCTVASISDSPYGLPSYDTAVKSSQDLPPSYESLSAQQGSGENNTAHNT